MNNKLNALTALNLGIPESVPLWELHFHIWNKYSDEGTVFGNEYLALPESKRDDALRRNAEIMTRTADDIGFGAVSIPDMPWDCPYTLPENDRLSLIRYIKALDPDFLVGGGDSACLAMPDSDEYMDFSFLMYDDPEAIDRRAELALEKGLRVLKGMSDAGADFVYLPSDLSDARAPYFNDEQLGRFFIPYAKKWCDEVRRLGIIPILHTDGDIFPLLDRITEIGFNGIQALDPIAGITVAGVREQIGNRLCLCGNLDCGLMLSGTPDEVYASTREIIMQGKGSPFMLGNSNAVVGDTPKENYDAFLAAWRDNRQY